jgi:hypothetical protein
MFHQLVTASLLLIFLTVSASGQQKLKGRQLDSVAHVNAISMNQEVAIIHSLKSVTGSEFESESESESVSSIALQEGLNGYIAAAAYYTDSTCSTMKSAILYPLDTCFLRFDYNSGWNNVKVIATSSTWLIQSYKDDQCAALSSSTKATTFSTTCDADGKKFILQSSKEVTTTQLLIYMR